MEPTHIRRRTVLTGLAAGALGGSGVGQAVGKGGAGEGRYVIGTAGPAAKRAAKSEAADVIHDLDFGAIGGAVAGRFPQEALQGLSRRPDVRYIERDSTVEAVGETLPEGIDRVDADRVHDDGATGEGADLAIIDTGIDADHPDLAANLGDGYAVYTCGGDCPTAWSDDHGHGTHCAGIADAADNTEGVIGVSTAATLHSVKVLSGDGTGYSSDVAEGIRWVGEQGYDVGSISLGSPGSSYSIRDACQYAAEQGVLLVGAAGNDGPCSDCVIYPAAYDTVVAVSAVDDADALADFSSTGPEVELAAPGVGVYSTYLDDRYASLSGTSMACPHVSGAGAQLVASGLSASEARQRLRDSAEDLGLAADEQGYGFLDVEAALGTTADTSVAVTTGSASSVGETVATLSGSLDDLGGASAADVSFEWGEAGAGFPNTTAAETLSSTGSFSASLSGLTAETDYEFRAVADASDGDTDAGASASFTTDADPTVVVSTGSVSGVGETTATFAGSLDDLAGASSADVAFEYRPTGSDTATTTATTTLSSTGSFTEDVSGLTAGTEYEVRAVADASDGDTGTGTWATFATSEADTSVAVSTGSASSVGETVATVSGSLDDLGGASAADVSFEWGEAGAGFPNTTAAETLSATGSFDASLSGLASGTDYEFRAVAAASDGDTDTGTAASFTTDSATVDETAPSVDSYAVREAGSPNPHAEITAQWSVSDANDDLDTVRIAVLDTRGRTVDSATTPVGGGAASGSDSFQIKHARGATFDVQLTVSDEAGNTTTATRTVTE